MVLLKGSVRIAGALRFARYIYVPILLHICTKFIAYINRGGVVDTREIALNTSKKTEVRFQKMASAISQKRTCLFQETDMRFLALQQCLMMNDMIRD